MMRKIKYALAFLWGAVFASSALFLFLSDVDMQEATAEGALWAIAAVFVILTSIAIIVAATCFFVDHWNEG